MRPRPPLLARAPSWQSGIELGLFTLRWWEKCASSLLLPHHLQADASYMDPDPTSHLFICAKYLPLEATVFSLRFGALALEILHARRRLTAAGLRSHYILPLLREITELRLAARIDGGTTMSVRSSVRASSFFSNSARGSCARLMCALAFVPVERSLRPRVGLFAPLRDNLTSSAQSQVPSGRPSKGSSLLILIRTAR